MTGSRPEAVADLGAGKRRSALAIVRSGSARMRRGIYLYGVTRAHGWRRPPLPRRPQLDLRRIRFRELEAIGSIIEYAIPELGDEEVLQHQEIVGELASRRTLLPAPPGIIFSGRRALAGFLDDQYLNLVEGLTLLEGHWEFRVHIRTGTGLELPAEAQVTALYAELRRSARAALTLAEDETSAMSAAFLVERGSWIPFVEGVEELAGSEPGMTIDLTGPWPPYDFVRLIA